jgi:DNA-binding FrmR family transcriptional regulator
MEKHCSDDVIGRLKRVEGQIKGILKMAEEGRDCEEILIQIKAAKAGLNKAASLLLSEHIDTCIQNAVEKGEGSKAIENLKDTLSRTMEI